MNLNGLIKEAWEFHREAKRQFEMGVKENNRLLLQDACEKSWNAVVLATNYLVFKKTHHQVRSHYERRKALEAIEEKDPNIREKEIRDRFSARAHYLHEQCFYGGNFEEDLITTEMKKVELYIKDIERLA